MRSVGFWLSVGATAGVTIIGPPLRRRLSGLGPLATPLAMTVAAQLGVLVPSVLVFGQFVVIGIVANLVAVPVAGLVMLYGLPASLVAGAVPALRGVLMAPGRARDPLGRHRRRRGRSHRTAPAVERRHLDRRPARGCVVAFRTTGDTKRARDGDNDDRMSVHVLTGDDESILRAAVNTLVQTLVGDGDRALMVDEFDAEDYTLGAVVDAAHTAPFLTERRVVVARAAGRFTADELAVLVAYLADPLPSTELVIEWGSQRRPKSFDEALSEAGATIIVDDAAEPGARPQRVGPVGGEGGRVFGSTGRPSS